MPKPSTTLHKVNFILHWRSFLRVGYANEAWSQ